MAQQTPPKKLEWDVTDEILAGLAAAHANINAQVSDSDLKIYHFREYGTDFIKTLRVSPDAFVQMALQLTYFRLHGTVTPVYETASTRKYLHGRTETCRSLSNESAAFVRAFDDASLSVCL